MTPCEYFNSLGVFDGDVCIAHGVWLEPKDLEILKEKNVSVATNPAANLKLGSGIADVVAMLKAGINVCLGTDGMGSNNNHNFLKEM